MEDIWEDVEDILKDIEDIWKNIEDIWKNIEDILKNIEDIWKDIEDIWVRLKYLRERLKYLRAVVEMRWWLIGIGCGYWGYLSEAEMRWLIVKKILADAVKMLWSSRLPSLKFAIWCKNVTDAGSRTTFHIIIKIDWHWLEILRIFERGWNEMIDYLRHWLASAAAI